MTDGIIVGKVDGGITTVSSRAVRRVCITLATINESVESLGDAVMTLELHNGL